jgi:transposase/Zn finger protein HypA/HybF involved in hydrogenase expression
LLARGVSVEKIAKRFGKHPSTVSYWMARHGLEAPNRDKHAAKGGIERERLEALVEAGMTIAEIAAEVHLSKATVRHWLRAYGLRTMHSRGKRPAAGIKAAKDAGLLVVRMTCVQHGDTEFVLEGRGHYRCKRCRSEAVARRRRKVKGILVAEAGGACILCGYSRDVGALHFHHVEPINKRVEINAKGVALALDKLRVEAAKCVLLCANCHAEVEDGVASLPDTVLRQRRNCTDS